MERIIVVLPILFWAITICVVYQTYMRIMIVATNADTQTDLLRKILAELKKSDGSD